LTFASAEPPAGTRGTGAARHPRQERHIGRYRWVVWHDADPKEDGFDREETGVLLDGKRRVVVSATDHRVELDFARDLTGDRTPEIVFHTWSGGAHGSFVYYVYSLGKSPQCLLVYDKNNLDGWGEDCAYHGDLCFPDFQAKDLNGDGRQEILTWYDGYAYWDCSYGGSARVPIVLAYEDGRYVDVTEKYPLRLRFAVRQSAKLLQAELRDWKTEPLAGDAFSRVVQLYATDLLLEGRETAQRKLLTTLPEKDLAEFHKRRDKVERLLEERKYRYAYPDAYTPNFSRDAMRQWLRGKYGKLPEVED
jgi:hypothetical protein